MRKVRVEKEMPGLDVGQEFNFVEGSSMLFKIGWVTFESKAIDKLISGGWLSWVEEERSLSEIVHNFLHEHVGSTACLVFENKIIDHFRKKFGAILSKENGRTCKACLNNINKMMFGDEK